MQGAGAQPDSRPASAGNAAAGPLEAEPSGPGSFRGSHVVAGSLWGLPHGLAGASFDPLTGRRRGVLPKSDSLLDPGRFGKPFGPGRKTLTL